MEVSALIGEKDTDRCRERLLFLPSRVGKSKVKRLCVGGHEMPLLKSPVVDDSAALRLSLFFSLDPSPSCLR
jgi:hypothetical protein